jgi:hypothetical protein
MKRSLVSEWRAGFLLLGRFMLAALIAIGGPLFVLGVLFTWLLGNPGPGPVYLLIFPGGLVVALGIGPVLFYRACRLLQVPGMEGMNSVSAEGTTQRKGGHVLRSAPGSAQPTAAPAEINQIGK